MKGYITIVLKRTIYAFIHLIGGLLLIVWLPIAVSGFVVSLPIVYIFSGQIFEEFWLDLFYIPFGLCVKIGKLMGVHD